MSVRELNDIVQFEPVHVLVPNTKNGPWKWLFLFRLPKKKKKSHQKPKLISKFKIGVDRISFYWNLSSFLLTFDVVCLYTVAYECACRKREINSDDRPTTNRNPWTAAKVETKWENWWRRRRQSKRPNIKKKSRRWMNERRLENGKETRSQNHFAWTVIISLRFDSLHFVCVHAVAVLFFLLAHTHC